MHYSIAVYIKSFPILLLYDVYQQLYYWPFMNSHKWSAIHMKLKKLRLYLIPLYADAGLIDVFQSLLYTGSSKEQKALTNE